MKINELLDKIETCQRNAEIARKEFPSLLTIVNSLEKVFFCCWYPEEAQIILHVATRADFAHLRALRHESWSKIITTSDGVTVAQYEGVTDGGVTVLCYVSELPPSCKIIEDVIEVPATPAHKEIRRRVECDHVAKNEVAETVPSHE